MVLEYLSSYLKSETVFSVSYVLHICLLQYIMRQIWLINWHCADWACGNTCLETGYDSLNFVPGGWETIMAEIWSVKLKWGYSGVMFCSTWILICSFWLIVAYILAERGPVLRTAETSPSHYLPHLNLKTFQLPVNHLLKNVCIGQVLVFWH